MPCLNLSHLGREHPEGARRLAARAPVAKPLVLAGNLQDVRQNLGGYLVINDKQLALRLPRLETRADANMLALPDLRALKKELESPILDRLAVRFEVRYVHQLF